jgi:sortase B
MKKIIKLAICMCLMLVSLYLIYNHYEDYNRDTDDLISNNDDDFELINKLKTKYDNNEIVMYLKVPGLLSVPVVQTENNSFYQTHDLYREESNKGTPYLDYRNKSLSDRKLIVYGHNKMNMTLIFSKLLDYQNKNFYDDHKEIEITTDYSKRTYKIFSVFTEKEDFDYLDLNGFPGMEYYEHLLKLKDKSIYDTEVSIEENSKTIVLQTCALENGCDNIAEYLVIIAREVKDENNNQK